MESTVVTVLALSLIFMALALLSRNIKSISTPMFELSEVQFGGKRKKWLTFAFAAIGSVMLLWSLAKNLNEARGPFHAVVGCGLIYLGVYALAGLAKKAKLGKFKIEVIDPTLPIGRPLLVGGVLLVVIGASPSAFDLFVPYYFDRFNEKSLREIHEMVEGYEFQAKYQPRGFTDVTQNTLDECELGNRLEAPKARLIVLGSAGAGKSWFARQLSAVLTLRLALSPASPTFQYCSGPRGLKPTEQRKIILVPLARGFRVEERLEDTLADWALHSIRWAARPALTSALHDAIIIVDGLDELDSPDCEKMAASIERFGADYPDSSVLVTSRPSRASLLHAFSKLEILGLNEDQMAEASVRRFSVLLLKVLDRVRKGASEDIPWQDASKLYLMYTGFCKRYALARSFRDMEIVDDLFLTSLFNPSLTPPSKPQNRNGIYYSFLVQKLSKDGRLKTTEDARNALVLVESVCKHKYGGLHGSQSFVFDEQDLLLRIRPSQESLLEALSESGLISKDKKGKIRFTSGWMNSYFYSAALAAIEKPSELMEVLLRNNFFPGTEIIPFLVGQNTDAAPALSAILSGLEQRDPQFAQGYVRENFDLILAHVSPTSANERYITTLSHQLPETLRPSAPFINGSIRSYEKTVRGMGIQPLANAGSGKAAWQ